MGVGSRDSEARGTPVIGKLVKKGSDLQYSSLCGGKGGPRACHTPATSPQLPPQQTRGRAELCPSGWRHHRPRQEPPAPVHRGDPRVRGREGWPLGHHVRLVSPGPVRPDAVWPLCCCCSAVYTMGGTPTRGSAPCTRVCGQACVHTPIKLRF